MNKKKFTANYQKQQGAVMASVLLLLVMITLLGVSSLRQGLQQSKLASSAVGYGSCFTAAESGLNAIIRRYQQDALLLENENNLMNKATASPQYHCLANDGLTVTNSLMNCPTDMTEYAQLEVQIVSRKADAEQGEISNLPSMTGDDIDYGGGRAVYTDSTCNLGAMDLAVTNTQMWVYYTKTSVGALEYTD